MTGQTVGEAAKRAGISVRALHHYDEIGLLSPSGRTDAGYRLYSQSDVATLAQILIYRELDFELDAIARLIRRPESERLETFLEQRRLLEARLVRDRALLDLVERTIQAHQGGIPMSSNDMLDVFGDFDPAQYEGEVQERWGNTDAYRESARRTKRYTKGDWQRFKEISETNGVAMLAAFDAGLAPDAPESMQAAEDARLLIDTWFYPCSHTMHLALGDMYIADARFRAHYDDQRPGLAQWFRDAIAANLTRARAAGEE